MNPETLSPVMAWLETTDLVEVSLHRGGEGFTISKTASPARQVVRFPGKNLVPVPGPTVGLFRWAEPGRPRPAAQGARVAAGDSLGLIETGGAPVKVLAPCAGALHAVCVEEGQGVQYGQPLFMIEAA